MGVELSIDPPNCKAQVGATSKHKLVNHTDKPLAYRVKPSDGVPTYTVTKPDQGIIQVGYTAELIFSRPEGKVKADVLTVEYASVGDDARDAAAAFSTGKPSGEIVGASVIKLSAAE